MAWTNIPDTNPWMKIEDFIDQICSFQPITPQTKMDVHSELFNYYQACIVRDIDPSDLYDHLQTSLRNKVQHLYLSINDMQDEDKLRLHRKYWTQYKDMSYILNAGCHRIQQHTERGNRYIFDIDKLSDEIWEKFFFQPLLSSVARACLNLITIHRNNNSSIDADLIKETIEIYKNDHFNLKMKKTVNADPTINMYQKYLESELLCAAEDFYRQQTMSILQLDPIAAYLATMVKHLDEKVDYHRHYLPPSTLQLLRKKLEEAFIPDEKLNSTLGELNIFLLAENYNELAGLYNAISRLPRIKTPWIKLIESSIHQINCQRLEEIRTVPHNNFKHYIETIYQIFAKYKTIIRENFNNDFEVVAALDTTYQRLVNGYSVVGTNGHTINPPELVARYCDALLRKGNVIIQDTDFEDKTKQMMLVFNYLEDKDIFIKFYEKMFVKRLLDHISISDDYEELMISKLEQVCGVGYTSKLQQIFQDARLSHDLVQKYKTDNHIDTVDFSVMVFGSNVWPLPRLSNLILPSELRTTFNNFTHLYNQQHSGRRLVWLDQYSKGEIQTSFTARPYNLQVSSMYQMVVLLLFNKSDSWTVQQIENETEIKGEILFQTINSLLQSKLLICPIMKKDSTKIGVDSNDTIQISIDFRSNRRRIDLYRPVKLIKQNDSETFHRTIDEDRNMVIHATIVRIMKARGTLKYTLLMQEVIDQLKSRFKPKIPLIKKSIDVLIDKGYLQRQPNDKDILEYLA